MYNVVEYSYEDEKHHLDDNEALEYYTKVKKLHPDALIVLDDLSCGHWDVDIYDTPEKKDALVQKTLDRFWTVWRKKVLNKYRRNLK